MATPRTGTTQLLISLDELLQSIPAEHIREYTDYLSEIIYHIVGFYIEGVENPPDTSDVFKIHTTQLDKLSGILKNKMNNADFSNKLTSFVAEFRNTLISIPGLTNTAVDANDKICQQALDIFHKMILKTQVNAYSRANNFSKCTNEILAMAIVKEFFYRTKLEEKRFFRHYAIKGVERSVEISLSENKKQWAKECYNEEIPSKRIIKDNKHDSPADDNLYVKDFFNPLTAGFDSVPNLKNLINSFYRDYQRHFYQENDDGQLELRDVITDYKKCLLPHWMGRFSKLKDLLINKLDSLEKVLTECNQKQHHHHHCSPNEEKTTEDLQKEEILKHWEDINDISLLKEITPDHPLPEPPISPPKSTRNWKTPLFIAAGMVAALVVLGVVVVASHGVALPLLFAVGGVILAGHGGAAVALGAGLGIFSAGAATIGAAIGYAAKKVTGFISGLFNKKSHDVPPVLTPDPAKTNVPPKMQSVPALLLPSSNTQSDKKAIGSASQPCLFNLRESSPLQTPGVGLHARVRSKSTTDKAPALAADATAATSLRRRHTYTQGAH